MVRKCPSDAVRRILIHKRGEEEPGGTSHTELIRALRQKSACHVHGQETKIVTFDDVGQITE